MENSLLMTLPSDWQDFWIQHPWAPPRVLIAKYGINRYHIDNWLRNNANARQVLDRKNWRLTLETPTPRLREILKGAWKYYVEEERGIDVAANDAARELIRIKTPGQPFKFLVDSRYLNRFKGYGTWIADGYTRVSFAICNIWPGRTFADRRNLLPSLFLQSKQRAVGRQDAIGLVKHIYLCFLSPALETTEEAKRRFFARHREHGFITGTMLRDYGMSSLHLNQYGVRNLLKSVADEFAVDLGLRNSVTSHWNGQEFRRNNPELDLDHCHYCMRRPVDLHHLLPRSEYPELTDDPNNVVPVCVQVHAAITRNTLGDGFRRAYFDAQKAWLNARPRNRTDQFAKVMSYAHRETIGFPTETQ